MLALQANFVEAWSNRGYALCELGRVDVALASYVRALALRRDPDTLNKRATALGQLGRNMDALANLDEALAIAPEGVGTWCNRANALRHLQRAGGSAGQLRPRPERSIRILREALGQSRHRAVGNAPLRRGAGRL